MCDELCTSQCSLVREMFLFPMLSNLVSKLIKKKSSELNKLKTGVLLFLVWCPLGGEGLVVSSPYSGGQKLGEVSVLRAISG